MADGYARETGRVGVCCATTGPGATNLITGVASAYADFVPLLVITAVAALLLAVLALVGIGVAMIYSATYTTVDLSDYWLRQSVFAAVGVFALIVIGAGQVVAQAGNQGTLLFTGSVLEPATTSGPSA